VFVEGLCQWLFCRTPKPGFSESRASRSRDVQETFEVSEDFGSLRGWYYQVVISASREVVQRPTEDVLRQVLAELTAVWPVVREARLLHSRQVTEHRAVFSPLPGSEALRPAQQSPLPNLQFAGDWTRTGWPATMEGAVRSGYLAAENILSHRGRPATVLQPDLPRARLFQWLFRPV
jgi:uncharacterized protein with NAD-binding domain and iron-sulfur cluster